jgi:methionyl-tRNA formyltransferase
MAVPPLRALVAAGHEIALVVTRVDRRRGRGGQVSPSPVKAAALELGLPVTHDVDDVLAVGAELGVVVAFGRIIKPHVLAELAMVNLHFSLLPRWRGAAPVERALLAGDTETGVCVMEVEEGLDTGGVYARVTVPIGPRTTATELAATLVDVGTPMLIDTLSRPLGRPAPQVGEPTYAAKIEPAELELDWTQPAEVLDRWVRVGGAWTTFRGRRLKIVEAEPAPPASAPGVLAGDTVGAGQGALRLVTVQPEGRAPMPWRAFANGARPHDGELLGTPPEG